MERSDLHRYRELLGGPSGEMHSQGQRASVRSLTLSLSKPLRLSEEDGEKVSAEIEKVSEQLHMCELRLQQSVMLHAQLLLGLEEELADKLSVEPASLRAALQGYLAGQCERAKRALTIDAVERFVTSV